MTAFKVDVVGLLFTRAINTKQVFEMATHTKMEALCMFNDISFKLGGYTMFLQLKDNPRLNKKIETSQILHLKGEFSILKYCKAFGEIKKQWMQNKDLQGYGRFEDSIFIVYTTAEMAGVKQNNADNTGWQKVICSGGKCFNFSEDKFPQVHSMFENFETCKQMMADEKYNSKRAAQNAMLLGFIRKVWNSKALTLPGIIEMQALLKELQDLGDLSHYKQFLSKFWFVTGQTNDHQLEELIKEEIGLASGASNTTLIYTHLKQKIHDWCRRSEEPLTRETPFWKDIKTFHSAKSLSDISTEV
jgi:hypothetical protein